MPTFSWYMPSDVPSKIVKILASAISAVRHEILTRSTRLAGGAATWYVTMRALRHGRAKPECRRFSPVQCCPPAGFRQTSRLVRAS